MLILAGLGQAADCSQSSSVLASLTGRLLLYLCLFDLARKSVAAVKRPKKPALRACSFSS